MKHIDKIIAIASFGISVVLFVTGFFIPPKGVIDGSVLSAGGILLAFAALAVVYSAIKEGRVATYRHGDTEVTINDADDENK